MTQVILRTTHTGDLAPQSLAAVRALVVAAFDGDFSADDWEHSLGGMHTMLWLGDQVIGHAAVVQRRLLHGGRALRTGYVEGVAVHRDHRRRGHAGTLMREVERLVGGAYDIGALSASDAAAELYAARGWQRWQGPTSVLTAHGPERTPDDDGGVYFLAAAGSVDLAGPVACDWRDGDVW